MKSRTGKRIIECAGWLGILALLCIKLSAAQAIYPALQSHPRSLQLADRIIVKFRSTAGQTKSGIFTTDHSAMSPEKLHSLDVAGRTSFTYRRRMTHGEHILNLPYKMSLAEARGIARRLLDDPDVEYAEPDQLMEPMAIPNDPGYANQWHYMAPSDAVGGVNLPGAWDITTGNANVVVAIIDTGLLPHADIDSNILDGSGRAVPGYDFISASQMANDGDGRDADPTDAGDWITSAESTQVGGFFEGCTVEDSSWHGTHVAGTIGAQGNNNLGVAGINWTSKILPVRALGKCGGYTSDIADAIRWAAGLSVAGVPDNTNPAKVINLSLGGPGACSSTFQSAIDAATAAGAVVVVAAGNSGLNMDSNAFSPANCNGVITVAATDKSGGLAYYSNYGSTVEISAPGGEDFTNYHVEAVYSTLDGGTTTALNDNSYAYYQGTSMATPHISGIVSLMLSANYALTNSFLTPAKVLSELQAHTRSFPSVTSGYAPTSLGTDVCNTSICGAGLADAALAVTAVSTPPVANAGTDQTVNPSTTVNLNGTGSSDDGSISAYAWTQTAGATVSLSGADTATPSFTAPASTGVLSFQLTVTDDVNITATASVSVTVNQPPTANAGSDQSVSVGHTVALDGSASSDGDGSISSYTWSQTAGTAVTLSGATTATPAFTAPATAATLTFQLTVTDNLGATATDTVNIVVNDVLTARAGSDQTARPGDTVTLDGSASTDPGGPIASYYWQQTSGTTVTLSNTNVVSPTFTAPNASDTLTFRLTVTNGSGETASDTVSIIMLPPLNLPPITNAGSDQVVTQGSLVILDGSGSSDPDGSISAYMWEQISGTSVTLSGANTVSASFTALATTNVLTFRLWTTDDKGISSQDVANVIVNPAISNVAPVANAGADQVVTPGAGVTLVGSASNDPDGSIASYSWVQTSGAAVTLNNANTASPSFTAPSTGTTLTFRLTVIDNQGSSAVDTVNVSVLNNNTIPSANAGADQIVNQGDVVTLDGTASNDPDGSITNYSWRQTSGTTVTLSDTGIASPTFTAPNVGEALTFLLSVTDNLGATAIDTVVITVNGPPSMGGGSVNGIITRLGASTTITFNVIDPDAQDAHTFSVTPSTLGNATFKDNILTYHATAAGIDTMTVTVTDNHGASDSKKLSITVNSSDIVDTNNDGMSDYQAQENGLDDAADNGDSDDDGIPDRYELGDPSHPADSDGDGIIDALEFDAGADDTSSLYFTVPGRTAAKDGLPALSNQRVEIKSNSGNAVSAHNNGTTGLPVYSATDLSAPDRDYNFPYGIYDFSVSGVPDYGTSTITIHLASDINLDNISAVRKPDINNVWRTYPDASIDLSKRMITLTLRDNDMFDADPRPGIIRDPIGLGVAIAMTNSNAVSTAQPPSSGGGACNLYLLCIYLLTVAKRYRKNLLILCATLLPTFAHAEAGAQEGSTRKVSPADLDVVIINDEHTIKEKMRKVFTEIEKTIGAAACSDSNQCAALPVGTKACGGYSRYLPYSLLNTDAERLRVLSDQFNKLSAHRNKLSGAISDCMILDHPAAECLNGTCQIINKNPPNLPHLK